MSQVPADLPSAHHRLDLRGIPCPLSFVKAKLFLEKLPAGDRLELWINAGEPVEQVPDSLRTAGHKVLDIFPQEEYFVLMVEKA